MTAWLIYGNVIFYSDKNDCAEIEGTNGLYSLMFFFLVVGYFQIILIAIAVCVLPCLIMYIRRIEHQGYRDIDEDQVVRIANSLNRELYDPAVHNHEHECAIC